MGKKMFVILVIMMSFSLIGIILIQAYFINNSLINEEKQFTLNAKRSLSAVSKQIEENEIGEYYHINNLYKLNEIDSRSKSPDTSAIKEVIIYNNFKDTNETIIYRNGILEQSYKVPSMYFRDDLDSLNLKFLYGQKEKKVIQNSKLDNNQNNATEKSFKTFNSLDVVTKKLFRDLIQDILKDIPIYKRLNADQVTTLLDKNLKASGINIDFEFAIFQKGLATNIQSENFEIDTASTLAVPIFSSNNSQSDYTLLVNFPNRAKFLLSTILKVIVLSIVFTLIIILAYSSAIYQLLKQKKISQIKTDFINNMTHEFKTPIATINLALDAIKNPKIISDQEKVIRYSNIIRDENKRMHTQVENVLRISRLDNNQLDIRKEFVDMHDLIQDAVNHVQLIVDSRQGYIHAKLEALERSVNVNISHFTNVLTNILDNAIKYSTEAPKIDIHTFNKGNNIILSISDQGSGMTKQVQKRIFEKFYREHSGDVHNVKGHGLGLAYVKRIIREHDAEIAVESEKGKGSTFSIVMPLNPK